MSVRKRDGGAERACGFAAGEFGEVGVLLLRHRGGAGGEGLGEFDEVELSGGVEGDLFGEARDVQAERAGGLGEVEHEVAVEVASMEFGVGAVEVERVHAAMVRSSASVAPATAPLPSGQRFMRARASVKRREVALEHGDVGEEPVRERGRARRAGGACKPGMTSSMCASALDEERVQSSRGGRAWSR